MGIEQTLRWTGRASLSSAFWMNELLRADQEEGPTSRRITRVARLLADNGKLTAFNTAGDSGSPLLCRTQDMKGFLVAGIQSAIGLSIHPTPDGRMLFVELSLYWTRPQGAVFRTGVRR
jgi:hypothetical protein